MLHILMNARWCMNQLLIYVICNLVQNRCKSTGIYSLYIKWWPSRWLMKFFYLDSKQEFIYNLIFYDMCRKRPLSLLGSCWQSNMGCQKSVFMLLTLEVQRVLNLMRIPNSFGSTWGKYALNCSSSVPGDIV